MSSKAKGLLKLFTKTDLPVTYQASSKSVLKDTYCPLKI